MVLVVGEGGRGWNFGLAAVTFLCDKSRRGKNIFFIIVKRSWSFWKHLGKGYKNTFALNSSVFNKILFARTSSSVSQLSICLSGSLTSARGVMGSCDVIRHEARWSAI